MSGPVFAREICVNIFEQDSEKLKKVNKQAINRSWFSSEACLNGSQPPMSLTDLL